MNSLILTLASTLTGSSMPLVIEGTFVYPHQQSPERLQAYVDDGIVRMDLGKRLTIVLETTKVVIVDHKLRVTVNVANSSNAWQPARLIKNACPLWPTWYGFARKRDEFEEMMVGLGNVKRQALGQPPLFDKFVYVDPFLQDGDTTWVVSRGDQVPYTQSWGFTRGRDGASWMMMFESSSKEISRKEIPPVRNVGYSIVKLDESLKLAKGSKPLATQASVDKWVTSISAIGQGKDHGDEG